MRWQLSQNLVNYVRKHEHVFTAAGAYFGSAEDVDSPQYSRVETTAGPLSHLNLSEVYKCQTIKSFDEQVIVK